MYVCAKETRRCVEYAGDNVRDDGYVMHKKIHFDEEDEKHARRYNRWKNSLRGMRERVLRFARFCFRPCGQYLPRKVIWRET